MRYGTVNYLKLCKFKLNEVSNCPRVFRFINTLTAEQLCCLSILSSRNLRRAPRFLLSDHRVEDDQEFTHAGCESYFLELPLSQQALIKSFDHRVATNRCQGGHIKYRTDIGAATSNMCLALVLATFRSVWGDTN